MSQEEQVIIVDEQNQELEAVPRSVMRRDVLLHRATYVIVENSKGEILIQKRSMSKDVYPGYYDPTTGGVVKAGETYEENVVREIYEEIGVTGVDPKMLFDFRMNAPYCNVWGRVYWIQYDGPIELVDGEVEECFFMPFGEYEGFVNDHEVMPDGDYVLKRYFKEGRKND